jgi:lanosterol synthase
MARTNGAATSNGTVNRAAKTNAGTVKARGGELESKTNYDWWRLENVRGRQIWKYLESEEERARWPQSIADKYFLGLDTVRSVYEPKVSPRF